MPWIIANPMPDHIGNEVPVNSPDCGFWAASIMNDAIAGFTYLTNRTWEAVKYVTIRERAGGTDLVVTAQGAEALRTGST